MSTQNSPSTLSTTNPNQPSGAPAQPPPTPAVITAVANNGNRGPKIDLQAAYSALATGLLANFLPGDTFDIGGVKHTRDELVTEFNGFVTAAEDTKNKHRVWLTAVQNERQIEVQVRPLRDGVHSILDAKIGKSSPQMGQYGFTPERPRKKTAKSKADAVTKAAETRAARGTKGKKQRKQIKAAPPAPAATPAPQPVAPAAKSTSNPSNGS
jgi:hypothetical protein